jgi:uroporphyrinogen-III synthase
LRQRGFDVVRIPLIRISLVDAEEVRAHVPELLECPWLLFASPSAATAWRVLKLPFSGRYIGVTGKGTAERVRQAGGAVRLSGRPATAAGLAQTFLDDPEAVGPVALPRGDRARPELLERLAEGGFEARPLVVYRAHTCSWPGGVQPDVIFLASPSAVHALPESVAARARLVAIGPTTGEALAQRGWPCEQAARPDAGVILEAILQVLSNPA